MCHTKIKQYLKSVAKMYRLAILFNLFIDYKSIDKDLTVPAMEIKSVTG